jgi:hypothetical protein
MAWNKTHLMVIEHVMYEMVMYLCLTQTLVLVLLFLKVTWLPCPSKTNKCWLIKDIPLGTYFLNIAKNSLNKKETIQTLFCIAMQVPDLENLM